jgi:hypothetical protein
MTDIVIRGLVSKETNADGCSFIGIVTGIGGWQEIPIGGSRMDQNKPTTRETCRDSSEDSQAGQDGNQTSVKRKPREIEREYVRKCALCAYNGSIDRSIVCECCIVLYGLVWCTYLAQQLRAEFQEAEEDIVTVAAAVAMDVAEKQFYFMRAIIRVSNETHVLTLQTVSQTVSWLACVSLFVGRV